MYTQDRSKAEKWPDSGLILAESPIFGYLCIRWTL
ncbi:hypothetical protein CITRIK5_30652 [Citricoccus sp. K5]|nr:hypothetical protein CITRIK5_30652 [Citricoccus sp. K5]